MVLSKGDSEIFLAALENPPLLMNVFFQKKIIIAYDYVRKDISINYKTNLYCVY